MRGSRTQHSASRHPRRVRCPGCGDSVERHTTNDGRCQSCCRADAKKEATEKDAAEKKQQTFLPDPMGAENPIPPKSVSKLSQRMAQLKDETQDGAPHLIIEARAGTGKTTTLIEGLKRVKGIESTLTPSPQQEKVWDAMEDSRDARTICFAAFNKSIATELQARVPEGCDAMTMHSMGYKTVARAFPFLTPKCIVGWRVDDIIADLLHTDSRELKRRRPELINATKQLVSLCKMNLLSGLPVVFPQGDYGDPMSLADLAAYYDVDTNGYQREVFDLVPRVLERCRDVNRDRRIDYDDMIWLPVALGLPVFQYDLLLVDEAQDLNRCQQAFAKRAGKRLILCGDPKQAIYGFAGADCESMGRLEQELADTDRGCLHLPLTVTRRCGKAIVAEANKIVPDFTAFETNPQGKISFAKFKIEQTREVNDPKRPTVKSEIDSYHQLVTDGDMVLCRVNAPLVSECFRFLSAGRKATIQGRDVGQGLISTIKKVMSGWSPTDDSQPLVEMVELSSRLSHWLDLEMAKESAKKNPNEGRMTNLQDRYDCLCCFINGSQSVEGVIQKIDAVFTDSKKQPGIRLSSVHKAKGLEADRVFLIKTKDAPIPHPMAKTLWAREQETHLLYVAITRAISTLVYVTD